MKRLLSLIILLAAISSAATTPETPPQWPPAPQPARLRFINEIVGPARPEQGRLGKVLRLLVGLDEAGAISADRLIRPTGVFTRGSIVYIADPGKRAVLRYDEKSGQGDWWPHSVEAKLLSPVGVAATLDGRLFVLDSMLRKVFILNSKGKIIGELQGDPQGMGHPAALAISDYRIYVSDVKNHRLSIYGLDGDFLQSFGRRGTKNGEFNFPTYLWFDKKNWRLWVNDSGNFRFQYFNHEGQFQGSIGENGNRPGYLARPRGLATDSEGHVYSADAAFDALQIFDDKNRLLLFVGRAGNAPGRFNMPGGLFIDGRDRLYMADTQNSRIQVFQYLKEVKP